MKLLIIGSEGFIGSHCVQFFKNSGHDVWGIDFAERPANNYNYIRCYKNKTAFADVFSVDYSAIINCAGNGNVPVSINDPVLDFTANSYDTIRILDAIRKVCPKVKYIHLSSAAVYGNPENLPINEIDETIPISPYGYHKLIAEHICKEYSSIYNIKVAIVRPFSVYGPGLRKQMFWDWNKKLRSNSEFELFGTGSESRDYIYIKDLVKAISLILEKGSFEGDIYNIGSGNETFIKEVAELFFDLPHITVSYKFNKVVRSGDPLNWKADTTKLGLLGFKCDYTLQEGIGELHAWLNEISEE